MPDCTMNKPQNSQTRHDWSVEEIQTLLELPLFELLDHARAVHRAYQPKDVQLASLLSIKTGGCPEDCGYCPQSAHHAKQTGVAKESLMQVDAVLQKARAAKEAGASRFCMGAAWREVKDGAEFDSVCKMVEGVRELGMEACVTLGMLKQHQAEKLKNAGLSAYNHNLDTSPEFYGNVITTRDYDDRLATLSHVRDAGITVCTGGIIGMGETTKDRASLLQTLSNLTPHPESVPINALVAVKGTPLGDKMEKQKPVDPIDLVRMVAVARITMPNARVRLSAGRSTLSREAQLLCLLAGANSFFYGEKLLTTPNNDTIADLDLLKCAGLQASA
ncbi:MAG: biotin synthase BioB [Alphaproteobacteria bacterium]|nr:biotin synthase BioB [Alphaproteobacteria bacterium]